jgi:hypothetical protein
VPPNPRPCPPGIVHEIGEDSTANEQLRHDRTVMAEVIRVNEPGILYDGAERVGSLLGAIGQFAQPTTEHEADLQLLMRVGRMS